MKLYSMPLSPFAARVRCAIYAKNLPVEIVTPQKDWRTSGEIKQFNPLNKLPVLVLDDGAGIPESQVILDYLDHAHEPSMLPADPVAAAKVRLVGRVVDGYVTPTTGPIFMSLDPKTGFDAIKNAHMVEALKAALAQVEVTLDEGLYAVGGKFSQADAIMTPLRFILEILKGLTGRPDLLDDTPRIAAYDNTVKADPVLSKVHAEMHKAAEVFMAAWRSTGDIKEASAKAAG